MTLNELVYRLWEELRGSIKDHDDIDERQLASYIHTQRALWISRELNKPGKSIEQFMSHLGCFELELVDSGEYCSLSTTDCKILRTVQALPKAVYKNNLPILRVGSIKRSEIRFNLVSESRARVSGNGKFNRKCTYAFIGHDNRLYFKSGSAALGMLTYIDIDMIAENPADLEGIQCCNNTLCFDWDSEYPVSLQFIDYILGEIVKNKYKLLFAPSDLETDSRFSLNEEEGKTKN